MEEFKDLIELENDVNQAKEGKCKIISYNSLNSGFIPRPLLSEIANLFHKLQVLRIFHTKGLISLLLEIPTNEESELEVLNLLANNIDPALFSILAKHVFFNENCKKLTFLSLANNRLDESCCEIIFKSIDEGFCHVQKLDLSSNEFEDEGIKIISKIISHPRSQITFLNLSAMYFSSEGIEIFAQATTNVHCKLEDVYFLGSPSTAKEFEPFVDYIRFTTRLKRIVLTDILISSDNLAKLGEYLNETLNFAHSNVFKKIMILCSCRLFPRLSHKSSFKMIPNELIMSIAECLVLENVTKLQYNVIASSSSSSEEEEEEETVEDLIRLLDQTENSSESDESNDDDDFDESNDDYDDDEEEEEADELE